jgi:hypothetical protein
MNPEQSTSGVKAWQWIVGIIVVIIIVILGYYLMKSNGNSSNTAPVASTTAPAASTVASNNGIVIADQFPGNIVYVSSVQLAAPGFVVIKADNSGTPGAVIGSKAFPAGINPGQINLTKSMVDGGTYYAALYADTASTGVFNASVDQPITDANGNAIMKIFHASANIPETKG